MAENAKGQAIQSLGSTHTYFRRYLWLMCMEIIENDVIDAVDQVEPVKKSKDTFPDGTPISKPNSPVFVVEKNAKTIAGEKGEWQIVAPGSPEGDVAEWLELIKTTSHMLLDLTQNEEDVMLIFKKNKVLFDTVKAADAGFFKEMMGKFTERKNLFTQEKQ
jgi:hypothetical protein